MLFEVSILCVKNDSSTWVHTSFISLILLTSKSMSLAKKLPNRLISMKSAYSASVVVRAHACTRDSFLTLLTSCNHKPSKKSSFCWLLLTEVSVFCLFRRFWRSASF
jgi:hypothetical protein